MKTIIFSDVHLENDVSLQNHVSTKPKSTNVFDTTRLQNPSPFHETMSNEPQNHRPHQNTQGVAQLGTIKLNQATASLSATSESVIVSTTTAPPSSLSSSNVIHQTNNKNTMLSSFASVIEGTKDLSISDEKQRSPKHQHPNSQQRQTSSKATSSLPKKSPLLENTNLNSVEAKLPAAPTVITPKPSPPTIKSGNLKKSKIFNSIIVLAF